MVETAREIAHAKYAEIMRDDAWFGFWKKLNPGLDGKRLEERFVDLSVPGLLGAARAALAGLLRTSGNEELKETIYEAMVLDNTLIRGR